MPNLDACVQMDSILFCVLCCDDMVVVWHFSFLGFIDFIVFWFFEERKRMIDLIDKEIGDKEMGGAGMACGGAYIKN